MNTFKQIIDVHKITSNYETIINKSRSKASFKLIILFGQQFNITISKIIFKYLKA